ncbi:Alpha/Beta hydrolase protein [Stachybotrys elegans]|uniref:Alpha/Beta hydrolase protein n=1 Tax=Stachybotrys elegans TaxID=80388 RepID=A0A8K0SXT7_9HYPO|nr:Alpha/Beta hydrolase protein [Stachybotrys elegans]
MAQSISPYQIAVPESSLDLLRQKLALTTLPGETDFSNDSNYGAGLADIKRLVNFWKDGFDWRKVEAELNKLPHYTTTVDIEGHEELRLHFVHQRSDKPNSIPLLFCHGWPGSFIEVVKLLPLLTTSSDDEPSFHVVAPSLPNFGFSQRTSKRGFGLRQHAEACHKLMLQLGYEKYATQGGDLGFMVTRAMSTQYPAHIIATHMNFFLTISPSPTTTPMLVLQYLLGWFSASEKNGLERSRDYRVNRAGYSTIQSTAPHTPGFALRDSPMALLAWVYEKLRDWTDSYPWTDEEVLTWISIYYFSEAGPESSLRIYYEMTHEEGKIDCDIQAMNPVLRWNAVPLGLSFFPRDVIILPSSWAKTLGPVVFEKRHDEGGHFAAYERPELLARDVKAMFSQKDIRARL